MLDTEHRLLEEIFPRHVLEAMATKAITPAAQPPSGPLPFLAPGSPNAAAALSRPPSPGVGASPARPLPGTSSGSPPGSVYAATAPDSALLVVGSTAGEDGDAAPSPQPQGVSSGIASLSTGRLLPRGANPGTLQRAALGSADWATAVERAAGSPQQQQQSSPVYAPQRALPPSSARRSIHLPASPYLSAAAGAPSPSAASGGPLAHRMSMGGLPNSASRNPASPGAAMGAGVAAAAAGAGLSHSLARHHPCVSILFGALPPRIDQFHDSAGVL